MSRGWLKVRLLGVHPPALEAVTHWCHQYSAGGVELAEDAGGTSVIIYFPAGPAGEEQWAALQDRLRSLAHVFGAPVYERAVREEVAPTDWAEAWKQFYGPLPVGRGLVIVPTWLRSTYRNETGRQPIYLDPGLAFGTGEHTTTQQALQMLEDAVAPGCPRVLDVGTGSGILAIAAARLGARAVLGLDIDPVAVAVARENIAFNQLDERIRVEQADVALVEPARLAPWWPDGDAQDPRADVVVSNILLPVLVERAAPLSALVRPGGCLILAGVLSKEQERLERAFTVQGMACVETRRDGQWLAARFEPAAD
ncbi:MAG TPA: 50S ribosomal protein L11 methyltransferase [Sphingobacteriaceae bacterium]|nr:50S ribosomal protein L11 methyltransferase [Sphingobacteriaceae bacterium]